VLRVKLGLRSQFLEVCRGVFASYNEAIVHGIYQHGDFGPEEVVLASQNCSGSCSHNMIGGDALVLNFGTGQLDL
jgi:hypothetical protein